MAFPTSPTNGQIYNGYMYNTTKGAWVKTGSILEQDSNVNGNYVLFSSGWMTCWQTGLSTGSWSTYGNVRRAISGTLIFPHAFLEVPHVVPTFLFPGTADTYGLWYLVRSLGLTSCVIQSYTDVVSHTDNFLSYRAEGWAE